MFALQSKKPYNVCHVKARDIRPSAYTESKKPYNVTHVKAKDIRSPAHLTSPKPLLETAK